VTIDEAWVALATPVGVPGSGRLRYGAAMTLWCEGVMGADMLECYRICAHLDGTDVALVMQDREISPQTL
jgi:hypothetical protein